MVLPQMSLKGSPPSWVYSPVSQGSSQGHMITVYFTAPPPLAVMP